jgi:tRNA modification GTPase
MFSTSDTIVAIATPPGRGGIGVVRISGPAAHPIALGMVTHRAPLAPRYATLTRVGIRRGNVDDPITSSASSGERDTAPLPSRPGGAGRAPAPAGNLAHSDPARSDIPAPTAPRDAIDEVIATFFPAPASYTGDDVIEISAHGSPVVLRTIVESAVTLGARLAEPGEFTLRAYLNGRLDLMQAEAVADLVESVTPLQARAAFDQLQGTLSRTIAGIDEALFDLIARLEASIDFPDEGYHFVDPGAVAAEIDGLRDQVGALVAGGRRGRLIREGLQVAIVGRPNVGKSSLFNALVGSARAIVTDVPGTTRDLVTETVDLDGLRVTLVDTAGIRTPGDVIEAEGVERTRGAASVADLVLQVIDGSRPREEDGEMMPQAAGGNSVTVSNKADLGVAWSSPGVVHVSATTGAGLADLRRAIAAAAGLEAQRDRPDITNIRHLALLERVDQALARAWASSRDAQSEEFALADLQEARGLLEEISGRRAPDALLHHIFDRFCIGK